MITVLLCEYIKFSAPYSSGNIVTYTSRSPSSTPSSAVVFSVVENYFMFGMDRAFLYFIYVCPCSVLCYLRRSPCAVLTTVHGNPSNCVGIPACVSQKLRNTLISGEVV